MSALGQKQTCAVRKAMSALHPIATAKADMTKIFVRKFCRAVLRPFVRTSSGDGRGWGGYQRGTIHALPESAFLVWGHLLSARMR
jgi:hypothetical protein